MKKVALFTSLLALAACGGGSGGHHGGGVGAIVPNEVQKPSHDTAMSEAVRASNAKLLSMESSISDETERTAYLKKTLGEEEYNDYISELMGASEPAMASLNRAATRKAARAATGCKSVSECHQVIFDKMKDILSMDIDDLQSVADKDIERALRIAGQWHDGIEKIQEWIADNKDEIVDAANKIYDNEGKAKEYWLDNANFSAIMTTGKVDKMTFDIDDEGKITGVRFTDTGTGSSKENPAVFYSVMKRLSDDTNEFDMTSNQTTGKLVMESFAKDLGLKYSDFGVVTANGIYHGKDGDRDITGFNIPFMGGYDAKKVEKSELASDMTFQGTAKGTVNPSNNAAAAGVKNLTIEDKNATLTFDKATGNETFTANFDNWYNVTATKQNGQVNIDFPGWETKDFDENYQFSSTNTQSKNLFETAYYGDNKQATEATALIQYQQQAKNPGENPEDNGNINLFLGFGGTAK